MKLDIEGLENTARAAKEFGHFPVFKIKAAHPFDAEYDAYSAFAKAATPDAILAIITQHKAILEAAKAVVDRIAGSALFGWRPIETAPKDGSFVDLWVYFPEHDLAKRVPSAKWDAEAGNWRAAEWHFGQYKYPPTTTHWMPLPEPPNA